MSEWDNSLMNALVSDPEPNTEPAWVRRRARIAEAMARVGGGIAILPTAAEQSRNADSEFPYRYDSHFHYLTGFAEPQAWLVVTSEGRSILFCRPRDPELEIWDGVRLGPEAAPAVLGVQEAYPLAELDAMLPQLIANQPAVWFCFGRHPALPAMLEGWMAAVRRRARDGLVCPPALRDLTPALDDMRLFKDDGELTIMRRAAAISAGAHVRAMRYCAERFHAGAASVREYEIEAELLHEFRRHGSQSPAYPSIVAAGSNACVLHHATGDAPLLPGHMCLIDAGCELDGYASDITRTFPAAGRFTTPQRELYEVVLAAQKAAIAATRPGARHRDAHDAAVLVLAQGMLDCGLLSQDRVGDLDTVICTAAYRRFFMHGTGHWIGRDVHDVGEYLSLAEAPIEQPDGKGGIMVRPPSRILQPGMVVTVEPGLYVRPADDVPQKYWHIGIRIEDDAVITPDGCELISRGVPVEVAEIEALMRS